MENHLSFGHVEGSLESKMNQKKAKEIRRAMRTIGVDPKLNKRKYKKVKSAVKGGENIWAKE